MPILYDCSPWNIDYEEEIRLELLLKRYTEIVLIPNYTEKLYYFMRVRYSFRDA